MTEIAHPRTIAEASVLVVESHALVLAALRTLISATPGMSVVGAAQELAEATELARRHRPDVVLIDHAVLRDEAELRALRREAPDACMVVLTDDAGGDGTADPGIAACRLANECGLRELCATVASTLGTRCGSCLLRPGCQVSRATTALTRRESDVAIQVANGLSTKQIAAKLGIGMRTVNTHRERLARKLGASSAAVVTRFVLEAGLLDDVSRG